MDGKQIKAARKRAGMSQKQFAASMGVKPSVISRMENDDVDLRGSTIKRIHEVTGANYGYLFGDEAIATLLTDDECEVIAAFASLSARNKEKVLEFCSALKLIEDYNNGALQ